MKSSGRSSSDMRWDDQESTGALEKAEVKKSSSATRDYDAERSKAMPQKKEIATKGSIDSVFGGQEDVVQQEAMEEEPAPIYSGKRDAMGNAMDDSLFDAPTQRPSSASAQPQRAEDNSAATAKPAVASKDDGKQASAAESKPEPSASVGGFGTSAPGDAADSGRGGGANNTTLDDVERAYKRNDYQETVDEADAYLARRIGTNQERARAMELKAQALTSLGRGTEARGIYESIRELYPDYYNKENLQQKKKRKAAPKQESIPSADESFNQSF